MKKNNKLYIGKVPHEKDNKHIKTILLTIILVLTFSSVTSATTYICCKNFTTYAGSVIADTNNLSAWTITPTGNSSIGNDTLHAIDGDTAVYWNTGNVSPVQARQTVAMNLSLIGNNTISYWAWSGNWSKVAQIKLLIYNNFPGSTPRIEWIVTNISYSASAQPDSGWQYFTYQTSLFTVYTPWNISNKTNDLRFLVYPVSTSIPANVTIDKVTFGYIAKPKFFFDFDDGRMNVSKLVYPVLSANGQRGTIFTTINEISVGADAIDLANMSLLYNAGWDVSSHGMDHIDLSAISNASLITQLNSSYDYLYTHGFTRSAQFIAYPVGYYNDNMLQYVKQRYTIGRTVNEAYFSGNIVPHEPTTSDTIQLRQTDSSIRDVAGIKAEINKTILRNGTMHLLMHNVQNDVPYFALNYNLTNLTEVSDYLVTRSADIDVVTYSDMVIESTPPTPATPYISGSESEGAAYTLIGLIIIVLVLSLLPVALGSESKELIGVIVAILIIVMILRIFSIASEHI